MDKSASEYCALQATVSSHQYRSDIDGLRAVAISAVIAYHFSNNLLPGGFLGVDMFFVISGYVIAASLSRQPHSSIKDLFLGFYCRRIKRLAPALLVSIVITCLLGALFIHPQSGDYSDSMKAGLFSIFGLSNIYFAKESLDYFGTPAHLNLFMHTWSLGVEEQFYLVFPALLWISGYASRQPKGRYFLFAAQGFLSVLSLALYVWLSKLFFAVLYFMMPSRFWELTIAHVVRVILRSAHDHLAELRVLFGKGRRESVEESENVVADQHLAIAVQSGTDAYGRNLQL